MKPIRRISATRGAALAGCAVAALALGACGSSGRSAIGSGTAPTPPVTAPAASGTASASPSPTTTSSSGPATSTPVPSASPTPKKTAKTTGLDAARVQWKDGANASSAAEGANWDKAAADLTAGKATDPGDTSFYPEAIKDLKELISLPDAQQTAAQNAAFKSDVLALDTFFGTPGLYQ